nr:hypothetical protein [Tanacetum cinerariifolium]
MCGEGSIYTPREYSSSTYIKLRLTITAVDVPIPAATTAVVLKLTATPSQRTKGVVISSTYIKLRLTITAVDVPILAATTAVVPKLTATPSQRTKGDKGKWILVEEPKPLKKQAQTEQDEKYARKLEAELNRNIDWDEVIDHVNKKAKEDPANVAGFKMDYFKGMSYKDIRPIFEAKFDSNVAFLQKTKEQIDEEESRALKRINETLAEKAAKRKKLDEEVEELKRHLHIVPNEDDDVYTEATPLAPKVPVVEYEIYNQNNKPYYKINIADERKYPLTKFTLDQMLNNVRLEVGEESEVSLELLSFGLDAAMEFKKNMLSV